MKNSSYFTNVYKNNAELFKLLSDKTGWNVNDLDYIRGIYSIFATYSLVNKTLIPAWASTLNVEKVTELAGLGWARHTWTPALKRFAVGPFLGKHFEQNDAIINNKKVPKFVMLSVNSVLLAAMQNAMGVFNNHPPDFGATLIWELHKTANATFYVKLFRSNYDRKFEELKVKDCQGNCDYGTFKKLMSNYTLDIQQWRKECYE